MFVGACYPGWTVPSRPEIFITRNLGHYARTARVAVIPFRNDYFDRQLGAEAAGCIKQALLHKDLFTEITVIEDAFWHNRKVDTGAVINQALYDVQADGFDLLIVGDVKAYQPSSAAETKAVVSARLIEIASGKTLWWGQASCTGRRGKTFLFWAENLSADPPSAHYLLQKSAEKIAAALRRAG
jgi:hypothetical protein